MSAPSKKSVLAKRANDEVGEAKDIGDQIKPGAKKDCTPKREKRASTQLQSDELQKEWLKAEQDEFVLDRPRREKQRNQIAEDEEALKGFVDTKEVVNQAIRDGKIWSGFRGGKDGMPGIGWTGKFASEWWDGYATKNFKQPGGWICTKRLAGCTVSVLQANHTGLEIGHRDSFYKHIDKRVDSHTVCDGKRHWEVYLVDDVVEKNEEETNLEPQCHSCNMKQNNAPNNGYRPVRGKLCPGATCRETKITDL